MQDPILSPDRWRFLAEARRATLATIGPTGAARLVPICFVVSAAGLATPVIHTPIDDKPKREPDPTRLARVRDIAARPSVTVLVDRWSEDWTELEWLRVHGRAVVLEPWDPAVSGERATAIADLRRKYEQYGAHGLERRPLIRIEIDDAVGWAARDG